jgi:hypothetical protein
MSKGLPWFRFYTEALDDPKVQRLSDSLFKTWVNLLCVAGQHGGVLPSIDDLAFRLRVSVHDMQQRMDELILAGLVDILPDKSRTPHNWSDRQFASDTSKERTRAYRERLRKTKCDVTDTVTVTAQDPDPEQKEGYLASEYDAAREGKGFKQFEGLGLGSALLQPISAEAKRKAASGLAIADAAPLVPIFDAWPRSKSARDRDALFVASAPAIYRNASPEVRAACKPYSTEPEPITPSPKVRASPELVAALKGRLARA